jgi:hypothetical protein
MGFSWSKVGNEAHAETRFGTVSIFEDNGDYLWRIAQPNIGVLIESDKGTYAGPNRLHSFEYAEKLLLINLAFLTEPPTVNPDDPTSWLADSAAEHAGKKHSFALGLRALPQDIDPAITARLRMAWILLFHEDWPLESTADPEQVLPDTSLPLVWQEQEGVFRAETRFGTAVIERQPGNFDPRIEHPSGAVYSILTGRHPEIYFSTFDKAEEFILDNAERLAKIPPVYPDDHERTLGVGQRGQYSPVFFALDVCAHYLSPDTDQIDIERFDHM